MRAKDRLYKLSRTLSTSPGPHHSYNLHAPRTTPLTPTHTLTRTMANTAQNPSGSSPPSDKDIKITLPSDLTLSALQDFIPYKTWRSTLTKSLAQQSNPSHPFHSDPYALRSITVQACDFFGGGRLGFIKLKADVTNSSNERLPGSTFMRGGSVAMLIVLQTDTSEDQTEHVILTIQARIPAGSLSFIELPAGMLDDSGTFSGAAAKEILEETGLDIKEDELINLSQLALKARDSQTTKASSTDEIHLQSGIYPSPGGSDEFIPIFLARKTMSMEEMEGLKGKLTGLRDHGEKITLMICELRDLWKVAARDGKTLAALALYEGLKREGRI